MDLTVVTKLGAETKDQEADKVVQKHLAKKLEKIEQRLGKAVTARVVLEEQTIGYEVTITLYGTPDLIGKAREDVLLKAVDAAFDKLTRQFETEAEKRTGRERQRRASGTMKQPGPA